MSTPNGKEYTVSLCNSCGEQDTIRHTEDCGYCAECGTPEDYEYVIVNDDGEVLGTERELR